jgi:putative tricarboxylic transport membrane protein
MMRGVWILPPLGLVLSTFAAFMISISGSREMRWLESLLAGAVMTLFCVVLFNYLLKLPFDLWPNLY